MDKAFSLFLHISWWGAEVWAYVVYLWQLKSKNPDNRQYAAELLANSVTSGNSRAMKLLVAALKDKSPEIREISARALGWTEGARFVDPLVDTLTNDGDSRVRWAAAVALARIGDSRAVRPVVTWLKSENQQEGPLVPKAPKASFRRIGQINEPINLEPFRALARTSRYAWMVEDTLSALKQLLDKKGESVTPEDLRAIADLDNIVVLSLEDYEQGAKREVDFSQVRLMARQELIRRGLDV